jgi:hypothetical protein
VPTLQLLCSNRIAIYSHLLITKKRLRLGYLRMKIKVIENFDGSFTLEPEVEAILFGLLTGEKFLQQVSDQAKGETVTFTEILFQPVPYSPGTPKGMPAELEQYHQSPAHLIINVPPNFMFAAKIFQPSRLCAIYQKVT